MTPDRETLERLAAPRQGGRVLVVDDEQSLLRAMQRALTTARYQVVTADDGRQALDLLAGSAAGFDAVVSDIRMPHMGGIELLRAVRQRDLDLPVLLVTGEPDVATAIEAVDLGAYKYVQKPLDLVVLLQHVRGAVLLRHLARSKREALTVLGHPPTRAADRAGLEAAFVRALDSMWIAYQPIVSMADRSLFGHEAFLRSREPALPHPGAVLEAAEQLGRMHHLGRFVRAAAAAPMDALPSATLFVNVHASELADDALFDPEAPLSLIAPQCVLEITERAPLDTIKDVRYRLARLRRMGFRLAVDDLGAGYAGLSSFAALEPDIIKLDTCLVRGIDQNAVKAKVVEKMTSLAHDLHITVVAECVETAGERDVLASVGCDLMQGYLFARPGEAFPAVEWP